MAASGNGAGNGPTTRHQLAGPLTTVATFPCGPLTDATWRSGNKTLWRGTGSQTIDPSCIPSGVGFFDTSAATGYGLFFFSPAICPSGYTVACSRWIDSQGPEPLPTETAMNCLPS
jgi:hypothetical protein